jgi:NADPH:quinone reductase-like Zn-dependent oxidoreductase
VQSYNEIKVSKVAIPQRRNDEVIVTILAAGVNFVDLLYVSLLLVIKLLQLFRTPVSELKFCCSRLVSPVIIDLKWLCL